MTNAKSPRKERASVTEAPKPTLKSASKPTPKSASKPAAKTAANGAAKTAPAAASAPSAAHKLKPKLVRDSFTIPKSEYAVLEALKLRAAKLARPTKKSELLRAGIVALNAMSDKAFLAALSRVPSLKTGRPKGPEAQPSAEQQPATT